MLLLAACFGLAAEAQASGFLVPTQPRQVRTAPRRWRLESEHVAAAVRGADARVTLTQVFRNLTDKPLAARYVFPLPDGEKVSGVTLFVGARAVPGQLRRAKDDAGAFEEVVRAHQEPALLRHLRRDRMEVSLAALPANRSIKVVVKYDQTVGTDSGVSEWVHPVHGAFAGPPDGVEFSARVSIQASGPLGPIYCPSYDLRVVRGGPERAATWVETRLRSDDPHVALYWSESGSRVGATLMTHWPAHEEQGYFLFLAEPSPGTTESRTVRPKSIDFVVDTSGSMAGEKLAQVKAALRQAIASLNPKDHFNVVAYNTDVSALWPTRRVFNHATMREAFTFVERLQTGGGTNIEAALKAVLVAPNPESIASVVVFLTDGRPTMGETDTDRILLHLRTLQAKHPVRIFSLGVGVDVHSVLLDRLALESRGTPEYVRPREDVERKMAALYQTIRYPILTDVAFSFEGMQASEVLPKAPPDLFRGSRVVLAGRYARGGQVELVLRGRDGQLTREYHYVVQAAQRGQGTQTDFPARVWATRKIAATIDAIRLHGNENEQLVNDIVRLSTRFGVVTEYTSFLASDARARSAEANREATRALLRTQVPRTVGNVAWSQSKNQSLRRGAMQVPRRGYDVYIAGDNNRDVHTIQLDGKRGFWPRVVANRTFYFRTDRGWVDAAVEDPTQIDETIPRWSKRFYELIRSSGAAIHARLSQAGAILLRVGDRTVHVVEGK